MDDQLRLLEEQLHDLNRVVTGQRHYLKVAAEYKAQIPEGTLHSDPGYVEALERQLNGIQAALKKAAEYEPRRVRNGDRRER